MKRIININISKDTPEETLAALNAALKTGKEKSFLKVSELYVLNEDIEKLHERYEQLFKQVKTSLNLSETQIQKECETLSLKYDFEIKELSKMRKVDYDKRQAEIKAREAEERPWRRCWLWRLLFQPLTNRAQDIIEERAEVDADIVHTAAENEIKEAREKLPSDSRKKLSKRELKRRIRDELKAVINKADNADVNEVLNEPSANQSEAQQGAEPPERIIEGQKEQPKPAGQLSGQITLDEVQGQQPPAGTRRPRPPRSCRKQ